MKPAVALGAIAMALPLMFSGSASAHTPADVTLTFTGVSTVTSVSPDVYYDKQSKTYYLFTTGMGIGVYTSADGLTWTAAAGAISPTGPVSDPSVIDMPDGTYRMYYAYRTAVGPGSPCSGKELRYATSTDLTRWTDRPGTLLADLGCGVPNVVRAGVDDYRLYYVRGGASVEHGTYLTTSTDGLSWTEKAVMVTPKDFVDPSVVEMPDGSWLMLTADFPAGKTPGLQKLYAGTSPDGFAWHFDPGEPLYAAPPGEGAFDPDVVALADGSLRAWWSQGVSPETARIAAGTVTIASSPSPLPPTKPTVARTAKGISVRWSSPAGAPEPESFSVQVRPASGGWSTVSSVPGNRTSASVAKSKLPAGAFSVRVMAVIGDQQAISPPAKVRRR